MTEMETQAAEATYQQAMNVAIAELQHLLPKVTKLQERVRHLRMIITGAASILGKIEDLDDQLTTNWFKKEMGREYGRTSSRSNISTQVQQSRPVPPQSGQKDRR